MRFMVIRKADPDTEAGALPTQQLIDDMGAFMDELGKAGIVRGGDGLHASAGGARLLFQKGRPTVVDGPFTETKELVAGYLLIDVPSLQDAVTWMKKWPASDGNGSVALEIRRIVEAEDFGQEFTDGMRGIQATVKHR